MCIDVYVLSCPGISQSDPEQVKYGSGARTSGTKVISQGSDFTEQWSNNFGSDFLRPEVYQRSPLRQGCTRRDFSVLCRNIVYASRLTRLCVDNHFRVVALYGDACVLPILL